MRPSARLAVCGAHEDSSAASDRAGYFANHRDVASFMLLCDSVPRAPRSLDLRFDPGLGCALPMSVRGGIATLVSVPQRCAVEGTPIDREFTSVEISPHGSVFRIGETFSDHTGCQYRIQGDMSP